MEQVTGWLDPIFRWLHLLAGILWIGHLYFFNFVNAQLVKQASYDADTKKKVIPELMPRALFWFRWGAAFTWITGFLLLGLVFYMSSVGVKEGTDHSNGIVAGVGVGGMIVAFLVYDLLWKSGLGKNEMVAGIVSVLLLLGLAFVFDQFMSTRGVWIHVGAVLGTIMAGNVWMRIWPAQRKIIGGVKGTAAAPDASVPAMAGLRSKHNTYMSVGLLAMMLNQHFVATLSAYLQPAPVSAIVVVLLGFALAKVLYMYSARPSTAQI